LKADLAKMANMTAIENSVIQYERNEIMVARNEKPIMKILKANMAKILLYQ